MTRDFIELKELLLNPLFIRFENVENLVTLFQMILQEMKNPTLLNLQVHVHHNFREKIHH